MHCAYDFMLVVKKQGDLAIAVLYGNENETVFSVKGGVSLHGKFIPEGKACVKLVGQRVQILLSRGDPDSVSCHASCKT